MIQRATNIPSMHKHNERFDAAWAYRYGVASMGYTEHWITCEWCSTTWLCAEGERLNSICLDLEAEMVEVELQQKQEERKTA